MPARSEQVCRGASTAAAEGRRGETETVQRRGDEDVGRVYMYGCDLAFAQCDVAHFESQRGVWTKLRVTMYVDYVRGIMIAT